MSEIIKTEAMVLSKMDYGDTSKIVSLYSKDFGKLSAIIKGGRSPKSKIGMVVDPLNHIQVVFYQKDTRELQIISSADLITHFTIIKEDLDKLKYSHAILELLKNLTVDHEVNERLFKGVIRILTLINSDSEPPAVLFGRFFMFFLSELGYEFQLDKCAVCGRTNLENMELSHNFELGILCNDCRQTHLESFYIYPELFNCLDCLKNSKKIDLANLAAIDRAIIFMERYLKYHVPDFKGIQSFQMFN
jgi:DNA repair protein RecO (recombination protein O)